MKFHENMIFADIDRLLESPEAQRKQAPSQKRSQVMNCGKGEQFCHESYDFGLIRLMRVFRSQQVRANFDKKASTFGASAS